MLKRTGGFTIVELLVVIVVIAILAAISFVSYQGIQQRATNAGITNVASQYARALAAYYAANGAYPPVPSQATPSADDRICLGRATVDHNSDGTPDCGNSDYPSMNYEPFDTALAGLITLPPISERVLPTPYQSSTFTGITLIRDDDFTVSGVSNPYYMMYVLAGGNQDCVLDVVEENSGSDPFPHTRPSSQDWSWSDGHSTMCVVPLPNP